MTTSFPRPSAGATAAATALLDGPGERGLDPRLREELDRVEEDDGAAPGAG